MELDARVAVHQIRESWSWNSVREAACKFVNELQDRNQIISISTTITPNTNDALVAIYYYSSPNNGTSLFVLCQLLFWGGGKIQSTTSFTWLWFIYLTLL